MLRKMFATVCLVALLALCSEQAQVDAQKPSFGNEAVLIPLTTGTVVEGYVVSDIDYLALRSGRGTHYPLIARIPPGARIEVIHGGEDPRPSDDRNFVPVRYNGTFGYAHKAYITEGRVIEVLP